MTVTSIHGNAKYDMKISDLLTRSFPFSCRTETPQHRMHRGGGEQNRMSSPKKKGGGAEKNWLSRALNSLSPLSKLQRERGKGAIYFFAMEMTAAAALSCGWPVSPLRLQSPRSDL